MITYDFVSLLWATTFLESTVAFTLPLSSPWQLSSPDTAWSHHPSLVELDIDANDILRESTKTQLDTLVKLRGEARWEGDYESADKLRREIEDIVLPPYCQIQLEDIARSDGGGSTWRLLYKFPLKGSDHSPTTQQGVLSTAHAALGMAVSCADNGLAVDSNRLDNLVDCARDQLEKWIKVHSQVFSSGRSYTSAERLARLESLDTELLAGWREVEFELRGRKASDAAFWFALAGVTDQTLFNLLTDVSIKELQRFGRRPSCRAKDVLAVIERLAAAGVRDNPTLEALSREILTIKDSLQVAGEAHPSEPLLNLHSDHCALMIWKFSTRQRKQKSFLVTAAQHWEQQQRSASETTTRQDLALDRHRQLPCWADEFDDPTLPLVVDVGCGMGVSLLGLASLESARNFVGVDLSAVAVGYASSVAQRWEIGARLLFVTEEAQLFLEHLRDTYPGPVELVLVQFPTPYRLPSISNNPDSDGRGNSQLPSSATDGFMVTPDLLRVAADLLGKNEDRSGRLVIQSNCEDVAVSMKTSACENAGFVAARQTEVVHMPAGTPTRRTLEWVEMGGSRAIGTEWSAVPLLPPTGRTETEIACILNGTPVHRCALTLR